MNILWSVSFSLCIVSAFFFSSMYKENYRKVSACDFFMSHLSVAVLRIFMLESANSGRNMAKCVHL